MKSYPIWSKKELNENLIYTLRAITQGERLFSATVVEQLYEQELLPRIDAKQAELTPREEEVFVFLIQGLENAQIAQEIGVREQSVRNYVSRVYAKLGVSGRLEFMNRFG